MVYAIVFAILATLKILIDTDNDTCSLLINGRQLADLEEGTVPQSSTEFDDDVITGAQLINATHKVVAFSVLLRPTVLHSMHAMSSIAAEDDDDDHHDDNVNS